VVGPEPHPSVCERALRQPASAALVCLLLTVLLTWPLTARLGSALPAGAGDLWQNLWNLWWWDLALREGVTPYWTPYFFHPSGADLSLHTHSPLNMLVFARLADPQTAYGLCVLASTWLSAFGMVLLAREVTGSARAGLVAGVVFAFFPNRLEQTLEHLNLFSTQFLPLMLWALLGMVRRGGWRWVIGLAAFTAANALCDWQLAMMGTALMAVVVLVAFVRPVRPRLALVRDLALAGGLAVLLALPAAWPLLRSMTSGVPYQKPRVERGVDLAFLLRPHFHHPLWGRFSEMAYRERRANPSAGFTSYLGVAPLLLAGVAVARRRRGTALWGGIFLGSLLLSLGAHARFEGRLLEGVTLPFAWLEDLPLLSVLRVANRLLLPAGLALAVLAALGFAGSRPCPDRRFALVLGAVVLDYLWLPYPLREHTPSPLYAMLRDGGPQGAVIDIPLTASPGAVDSLRAQLVHGRPIAGGYVSVPSRATLDAIAREPALQDLYGFAPRLERPIDRERLRALGFGVVLLHKDRRAGSVPPAAESPPFLALDRLGEMPAASIDLARERLEAACGAPFYEDERVAAFRLAPEPDPAS
jgi:hypothetical protein